MLQEYKKYCYLDENQDSAKKDKNTETNYVFDFSHKEKEREEISSLSFFQKLKLCFCILFLDKFKPVIKINENISIDLKSKTIIFNMPFKIYSKENIELVSKKHIILESGKTEEERKGYKYSIWLNPPRDILNRPVKKGD